MKLYDWRAAPNARRVRIFLAEKGIEIPIEEVGVPKAPTLTPEFLALSPSRLVPVLELDDGTRISEAMAICRYLEMTHPTPPLMGRDPKSAALAEMWERRGELEGIQAAGEMLRNSHPGFVDRGLPGFVVPVPQISELVERGRARIKRFFGVLDAQLEDRPFVAGDDYTVADITALCAIDFAARACKMEIPDAAIHLRRWHDAVSSRPSART